MKKENERFVRVCREETVLMEIYVDKETRVQYLWHFNGLTVLVDPAGKPLLYQGEL